MLLGVITEKDMPKLLPALEELTYTGHGWEAQDETTFVPITNRYLGSMETILSYAYQILF
jgi:hypothetical protein